MIAALALSAALAADPPAEPWVWNGFGIPYASADSINKLGFGAGAEIVGKPRGLDAPYRAKITLSTYLTLGLKYQSHMIQFDWRGPVDAYGRITFQAWNNYAWAGSGGEDVSSWHPDDRGGSLEDGNNLMTPALTLGATKKFTPHFGLWGLVNARWARSRPASEGLLVDSDEVGVHGDSFYADLSLGAEYERLDRWPLPNRGIKGEVDFRGGGTAYAWPEADGRAPLRFYNLLGVHGEVIGWVPLGTEHLVLGGRLVAEKSFGPRPYYEQNLTAGQWRDELAYEQQFMGYGRQRTRGDGLIAALVELRPYFGRVQSGWFDMKFYASLFAEEGFLFDGNRLGPHLPTVGGGPMLVWGDALQLRPWVAVGWMSEFPGAEREPSVSYGLSFLDPL